MFQDRVDHRIAVDLEHNSALHERAKTRKSGLQAIRPNGKVRQNVRAGLVRNCGPAYSRVRLSCTNFNAGQYGTALILHAAGNLGCCLRPRAAAPDYRIDGCALSGLEIPSLTSCFLIFCSSKIRKQLVRLGISLRCTYFYFHTSDLFDGGHDRISGLNRADAFRRTRNNDVAGIQRVEG